MCLAAMALAALVGVGVAAQRATVAPADLPSVDAATALGTVVPDPVFELAERFE